VYILDRTNGKPLIGVEERPVSQEPRQKTAKTQPFPLGDAIVPQCAEPMPASGYEKAGCIFEAFWEEPVLIQPSGIGGTNWAPMSYNPETGSFYVPGTIRTSAFGRYGDTYKLGLRYVGGTQAAPIGSAMSGTFTAIGGNTNKIVWQHKTPYRVGQGGGSTTTAGGLVFRGEPDGNFLAINAKTGEELWRFQTGFGADAPPAVYEVNGEEYVAIATGGNQAMLSANGDAVWVFSLKGQLGPLWPPPVPQSIAGPAGPVADGVCPAHGDGVREGQLGYRRIGKGPIEDPHLLGARQLLLHLRAAPVDVRAGNRRITETKGRAPRLPGGGSRQPHAEQRGGGLRRQLGVIARYLEQPGFLCADLDVAQFPANRGNLAFVGCDPGITLHRDAFLTEPQRADRAALWRFLVHLILRRRDAVDRLRPHRFAQQTGITENRQLLWKREFDDGMQFRQDDVADRAIGTKDKNRP
jgi:glucose dehydrogenase